MSDTLKLIAGPFLALIPILIWELKLKPYRQRRAVGLLLLAEIDVNLQLFLSERQTRLDHPNNVPGNFVPSHVVFDSVFASLGELPPDITKALVRLYSHVRLLTDTASQLADLTMRGQLEPDMRTLIAPQIGAPLGAFKGAIDHAISFSIATRNALDSMLRADSFEETPPLEGLKDIEERAIASARRSHRSAPASGR